MPTKLSFSDAMKNARDVSTFPRWFSKKTPEADHMMHRRVAAGPLLPAVDSLWRGSPTDKFFAIGSCFAREIEGALADRGVPVLSQQRKDIDPLGLRRGAYMNRYTPMAMLHDIELAHGARQSDPASIVRASLVDDEWLDLHAHPVRGLVGEQETLKRREELNAILAKMKQADVLILTLGLAEAWYDTETGDYINTTPVVKDMAQMYRGRFEFHILDYSQCFAALERMHELIEGHRDPMPHIVVTTSPVPLLATFSGKDVAIANSYSKSMLRACADAWAAEYDGITYFPSYEMALLSNPDLVWAADRAHIKREFVKTITDHFMATCMEPKDYPPILGMQSPHHRYSNTMQ